MEVQKAFPSTINLHKRFESKKPPCIPHAIKIIVEEILERARQETLRVQPYTIESLIEHASQSQTDDKGKKIIQELLSNLINERRPENDKEKDFQRIACCSKYHTHLLLGALLEFFKRCEGSVAVKIRYPVCGWLILGPPLDDPQWKKNENRFTQEVEDYLREICQEDGVRKDFFCYMMRFLSSILQQAINAFRSRPIIPMRLRRIIANKFSGILIKVICSSCANEIILNDRSCSVCQDVQDIAHRPVDIGCLENILQYTPITVWDEAWHNPRPNILVPRDPNNIRNEIRRIFYKTGSATPALSQAAPNDGKKDSSSEDVKKKKKKKKEGRSEKSDDGEKKKKKEKKKKDKD